MPIDQNTLTDNDEALITVLMPVFNGEKYLSEAIDSILDQTYTNFEFLIINDGSTDKTEQIILSYNDNRIIYIKSKANIGLTTSLNLGIKLAKGKYIARMDSDDISCDNRLLKQVNFLNKNSSYGVCGTNVKFMTDIESNIKGQEYPQRNKDIRLQFLWTCPICHPSVMIRKELFNFFNYKDKIVEDLELWFNFLKITKFYNLSERLIKYRLTKNSYSRNSLTLQNRNKRVLELHCEYYSHNNNAINFQFYKFIKSNKFKANTDFLNALECIWFSGYHAKVLKLYFLNFFKISLINHILLIRKILKLRLRERLNFIKNS
jgi:glycosyltransferase involved in cell wall biosynthesis